MADLDDDLEPHITQSYDEDRLTDSGAKPMTRIRFKLGSRMGPFDLVVDRGTPMSEIRRQMEAKRDEYRGLVRKP